MVAPGLQKEKQNEHLQILPETRILLDHQNYYKDLYKSLSVGFSLNTSLQNFIESFLHIFFQ